jgi:hypothetical protein
VSPDVAPGAERAQVVRLVAPAEDDRRDVIDLAGSPTAAHAAEAVAPEHLEAERSPTPRRSSAARMNLARLTVRATRDRADDRRSWHPETVDRRRRSAILSGGVATRLPILSGGERVRRSVLPLTSASGGVERGSKSAALPYRPRRRIEHSCPRNVTTTRVVRPPRIVALRGQPVQPTLKVYDPGGISNLFGNPWWPSVRSKTGSSDLLKAVNWTGIDHWTSPTVRKSTARDAGSSLPPHPKVTNARPKTHRARPTLTPWNYGVHALPVSAQ